MSNMVIESSKEIPIVESADVLVVGAGIAGVAAALAAARCGAKTILLEREYALGGMATLGLITIYLPLCDGMGHQVVYGIGEELFRLSISEGAEANYPDAWLDDDVEKRKTQRYMVRYNPNIFALLTEKLLVEAGVHILYGTHACGIDLVEDRINCVIIENKSGRSAINVRTVVDCSGDADICQHAGVETYVNPKGNGLADWYYYFRDGKVDLNMFGLADVVPKEKNSIRSADTKTDAIGAMRFSGVDGFELSAAVIEAHKLMLSDVLAKKSNDADFVPVSMSSIPLVRMSRRICGQYTIDEEDANRRMDDSVGMTGDWTKRGPIYEVPYRSLVSDKISNLVAAGRIISTSDSVWNVTRVIPPCAVTGQAAGTAAAIFDDLRSPDIVLLQKKLIEQNVKLHIDEVM